MAPAALRAYLPSMTQRTPKARVAKAVVADPDQTSGSFKTKVVVRSGNGKIRSTYSFGGAVLRTDKSGKVSNETIAQSHKAMRELVGRLMKPGVRLPDRKGIPKFYADEADPDLVVRELDGKRERGRFEDGSFKAVS